LLPEDLPTNGSQPAEDKASAYGFTTSRPRNAQVTDKEVVWEEWLLVVRFLSYAKTMQASLICLSCPLKLACNTFGLNF
jgi:hypothetical protein